MNMRITPLSRGRATFCGSGGGSDCPALRVTEDGKIAISSSLDESPQPKELIFDGHELWQLAEGIIEGSGPRDVLIAIHADVLDRDNAAVAEAEAAAAR